jgi:hypothetical protein
MRDAAGERRDVADAHLGPGRRGLGGIGGLGVRLRWGFLVAATDQCDGGGDERNAEFVVHEDLPGFCVWRR